MADNKSTKAKYSSLRGIHRAIPIIMIAAAVFLAFCFIINDMGVFGNAIERLLLSLFSGGAYSIPLLIVLHAVFYPSDLAESRMLSRLIFSLIALVSISSLMFAANNWDGLPPFNPAAFYTEGMNSSGGLIGGMFGFCLIKVFSKVGLIIIAAAIFAIYISYFFARGQRSVSKLLYTILKGIVMAGAFIEEKLKKLFGKIKNAKSDKQQKTAVRNNAELTDDEFFAVDNGLGKLEIEELGIKEVRDSYSAEMNPTLQNSVFHKSAATPEDIERMKQREKVEELYNAIIIEETPAAPKNERRRSVSFDYGDDDAAPVTKNDRKTAEEPANDVRNTSAPEKTVVHDESADAVFTQNFDPFELLSSEELASKPSSRSMLDEGLKQRTVTEDISELTEAEVERSKKIAEFERRKSQVINSRRAIPVDNGGEFVGEQKNVDFREHNSENLGTIEDGDSNISFTIDKTSTDVKEEPTNYTAIGFGTESDTVSTVINKNAFTEPETIYFHTEPDTPIYEGTVFEQAYRSTYPTIQDQRTYSSAYEQRPVTPAYSEPVNTYEQKPVIPTYSEPVNTYEQRPVIPTYSEPVNTYEQRPVTPAYSEPVNTYEQRPVTPAYSEPVNTYEQRPVTPAYSEPANTYEQRPVTPAYSEPINTYEQVQDQSVSDDKAQPETTQPTPTYSYTASTNFNTEEMNDNDEYVPAFKPFSAVEIETDDSEPAENANDEPATLTAERTIIRDDSDAYFDSFESDDEEYCDGEYDGEDADDCPADDTEEIPPEERNPVVEGYRNMFHGLNDESDADDDGNDGEVISTASDCHLVSPDERDDGIYITSATDTDDGFDKDDDYDVPPFDTDDVKEEAKPKKEEDKPKEKKKKPTFANYKFPPVDLLGMDPATDDDMDEINDITKILIETLASFGVTASIKGVDRGPRITRYEVVPARGVKVNAITNLFNDIIMNIAREGIRMEAPIPGKSAIGFEIPNRHPRNVRLRELIECEEFTNARSKSFVCIGKDVAGNPVFADIAKFPHALIAGATGMGKSVCINSILISMLYKARPDEVKLIMIDPKKVEFKAYSGIPHLLIPVITEAKQAAGALMWAVEEMERRFDLIEKARVRNLEAYNEKAETDKSLGDKLPKIFIVIDEFADLMMQVRDPVEDITMRLAQKARAAGIHIIIGTQRPDVKVITGTIKANIPTRMSCKVSSVVDSRTILENAGAEKLLDKGDMLFKSVDKPKPLRVQGAFVSDSEVESIMEFLTSQVTEDIYDDDVFAEINRAAQKCGNKKSGGAMMEDEDDEGPETSCYSDPQFLDAVDLAIRSKKISTSLLQRKMSIGYGKAAKYIDIMESIGVVSEPNGQKPRDVLISRDEWDEKLSRVNF